MRRIKFRVWDAEQKIMYIPAGVLEACNPDDYNDPQLVQQFNYDFAGDPAKYGSFPYKYWFSKNCIIQQYIGLKDANGVEICEKDILSLYDGEEILLVEYVEEYAKFGAIIYLQDDREPENDCWRWFDENIALKCVVIGDGFQNSNLLNNGS